MKELRSRNDFIKKIIEETELLPNDLLFYLLDGIRNYSYQIENKVQFINILFNIYPTINDSMGKIILIENLVLYLQEIKYESNPCYESYDCQMLFEDYLKLCQKYNYFHNNFVNCLNSFIYLGVDKDQMRGLLVDGYSKEKSIYLLSHLKLQSLVNDSLSETISKIERIKKRYDILGRFLLITHPVWSENIMNTGIIIEPYKDFNSIYSDWEFTTKQLYVSVAVIKADIITYDEAKILNKLGDLIQIADKDKSSVSTIQLKELYQEIFGDRNILDVFNKLPV